MINPRIRNIILSVSDWMYQTEIVNAANITTNINPNIKLQIEKDKLLLLRYFIRLIKNPLKYLYIKIIKLISTVINGNN